MWTKVLKGANPSTGCSMISMDPKNPKTLFAGMWDFRRKGWTFRSGGEGPEAPSGSGLFRSTDGGATWTELTAECRQGLAAQAVGTRRRDGRAVEPESRLRVHRSGAAAQRALSIATMAARPGRCATAART